MIQMIKTCEKTGRFMGFVLPRTGLVVECESDRGTITDVGDAHIIVDCGPQGTHRWAVVECSAVADEDGVPYLHSSYEPHDTIPYSKADAETLAPEKLKQVG